jgi:N-methylhydantoinase B
MTQSLVRAGRSGVLTVAKDFSSGITFAEGGLCMIDEGLPAHSAGMHLVIEHTLEAHDEINPGDCFLTNSPYAGNTHHADYTLMVPIFYEDELLFWSLCRAHQADVGANEPTTYLPAAKTIYEEGFHYSSIKVAEEYEQKEDIIRSIKLNIRLGEDQWYGDYLAQTAAVRAGEEGVKELCDDYGVDVVKDFISSWKDYGENMMRASIRDLPEKELDYTIHHDPIPASDDKLDLDPDIAPEGVPENVKLSIDPEAGEINVDLTDNIENIPAGFNLCEATVLASVYTGIWNNLNKDIPRNEGSMKCVNIEIDEGKIIGVPEYPVGTSLATTLINDDLINAIQASFGQLGEPHGVAEGNSSHPPTWPVVSGEDHRYDDDPYINQIFHTGGGGPAVHGHDGWMTYGVPAGGGALYRSSIELDEFKYPMIVHRNETVQDTEGAGKWRGAPAFITEYGPLDESDSNPMTVAYIGNKRKFPPEGILGGGAGGRSETTKIDKDGNETLESLRGYVEVKPGESITGRFAGGGGYGDPLERDPRRVVDDVEKGLITIERAKETYGVVIRETSSNVYELNEEKTEKQRRKLA